MSLFFSFVAASAGGYAAESPKGTEDRWADNELLLVFISSHMAAWLWSIDYLLEWVVEDSLPSAGQAYISTIMQL